jgi:hypothetical protein
MTSEHKYNDATAIKVKKIMTLEQEIDMFDKLGNSKQY